MTDHIDDLIDDPDYEDIDFDEVEFFNTTSKKLSKKDLDIIFPPADRKKAYQEFRRDLYRSIQERLQPKQDISLDEWVEQNWQLPTGSPVPGKYSFAPAEFQRDIFRAMSSPDIRDIIICAASQTVKTQAAICLIGYVIDVDPSPILMCEPSDKLAHAFAKTKLLPQLHQNIPNKILRKSTLQEIHYYGGECSVVTANSPQQLAMRTVKIVIVDEVDELDMTKQGSPLTIVRPRISLYDQLGGKVIAISSPRDHGIIWDEYQDSDQRSYFVQCPDCQQYSRLEWPDTFTDSDDPISYVTWQGNDWTTAGITCCHCGSIWDNDSKDIAVKRGHWRIGDPDKSKAGYRINTIYSSFVTLETLVKEYIDATQPVHNPGKLIPFYNTRLALRFCDYDDSYQTQDTNNINDLHFGGDDKIVDSIPFDGWCLYAGIDQQTSPTYGRFEVTIAAINTKTHQICVISHTKLTGNLHYPEIWQKLDQYIRDYRYHGKSITFAAIDSMPLFSPVKSLTTRNHTIKPIKGDSSHYELIDQRPRSEQAGKVYHIGSYISKETIASLLTQGSVTWLRGFVPDSELDEYWRQLNSERRVTKIVRGRETTRWEATGRNEVWDCLIYTYCISQIKPPKKRKIKRVKSDFSL